MLVVSISIGSPPVWEKFTLHDFHDCRRALHSITLLIGLFVGWHHDFDANQPAVLKLNTDNPTLAILEPTFNVVLDRFIEEEKLLEIKQLRPGEQCDGVGELIYSTAVSYLSVMQPRSTTVSDGIPFVTAIVPGWTTPARLSGCSRSSCDMLRSRPR